MVKRMYKSGSGFAFWRWTDVETDGSLYLRRLHLVQIPHVGAIMLHWIKRADRGRVLHDHPVSFLSVVLRGWYFEDVPKSFLDRNRTKVRPIRWFNFKRATDAHRISYVPSTGVLTLVFAGPKRRNWGFHTPSGWVRWQDYKEKV